MVPGENSIKTMDVLLRKLYITYTYFNFCKLFWEFQGSFGPSMELPRAPELPKRRSMFSEGIPELMMHRYWLWDSGNLPT